MRAPRSRPAGPTPRSTPSAPPATGPAPPPCSPRSSRARTRVAPARASSAIAEAGVARVVVALEDPDPQVAGQGIARLRDLGITVDVGVGAERRRAFARAVPARTAGSAARSRVVKTAMSLDGRIAAADGSSQWITGADARADAHRLRADSQAIVVGAGTALADHPRSPSATSTRPSRCQPLRVLLDATGRVPADGPLFDPELAPTLVVTTDAAPDAAHASLARRRRQGAHGPAGRERHRRRPRRHARGARAVSACCRRMVEGGAALTGALVEAGLVDRLVTYVAPTLLGRDGRPALDLAGPARIADAPRWRLVDVARVGDRRPPRLRARRQSPAGVPDVHRHRRGARHRARHHPQRGRRAPRDRRRRVVLDDAELGASIAVNGCCLTVVELATTGWAADAVTETLDRTSLGGARTRAIRSTSNARCASPTASAATSCRATSTASARVARSRPAARRLDPRRRSRRPPSVLRYVVEKGSITVDGISLTVAGLDDADDGTSTSPSSRTRSRSPRSAPGSPATPSTSRSTCSPSTSNVCSPRIQRRRSS